MFNPAWFSGGLGGRTVPPPTIFGLNLGVAGANSYPRVVFGVFLLVIVTLIGLSVARMRGSATGRMLIAVRSNERAAAAAGIRVAPAKLFAFALSAFIAGLGGGLLGYLQGTVSAPTFATFTSLTLLAIAYVAGIGRVAGAVIAGLLMSANGLFVNFLNEHLSIGQYQTIVAGVALALTAIKNPDGVASELASATRGPGRWLGAVRDRVVPVRGAPGPGASAPAAGAPDPWNPALATDDGLPRVSEHHLVDRSQHLGGTRTYKSKCADAVAYQRGHGGGLGTLAAHVADDQPATEWSGEHIVEVAAHLVALANRVIGRGERNPVKRRQALRQQTAL